MVLRKARGLLAGLCPACRQGRLFAGPVRLVERCDCCGLDVARFNVGDGPAAFLILVVGTLLVAGALLLDAALEPSWWAHLVWLPLGVALTLGGLRVAKTWLVGAEHRNAAREGRLVR